MKFELIEYHHHSLLKRRATETAFLEFVNSAIAALERREVLCGISLDLSKAFDSIINCKLFLRLDVYGMLSAALS